MNTTDLFQWLNGSVASVGFSPDRLLVSLLLAFILGQVLAWIYYATHSGLSYSRSFVQSLIVITIVVAMVMATIADSIVTALGLLGALSIIRFRNPIKDTRDITFIFSALVVGMATGAQYHAFAIVGTVFISFVLLYLHWTDFGAHQPHNGFLRFASSGPLGAHHPIKELLSRFCSHQTLISMQDMESMSHYAYQIMIRDVDRNDELLEHLGHIEGLEQVSLTMQEQLLEI